MTRHEYLTDEGTRYRQSSVIEIPFLETRGEPLALELDHFVDCVRTGARPGSTEMMASARWHSPSWPSRS